MTSDPRLTRRTLLQTSAVALAGAGVLGSQDTALGARSPAPRPIPAASLALQAGPETPPSRPAAGQAASRRSSTSTASSPPGNRKAKGSDARVQLRLRHALHAAALRRPRPTAASRHVRLRLIRPLRHGPVGDPAVEHPTGDPGIAPSGLLDDVAIRTRRSRQRRHGQRRSRIPTSDPRLPRLLQRGLDGTRRPRAGARELRRALGGPRQSRARSATGGSALRPVRDRASDDHLQRVQRRHRRDVRIGPQRAVQPARLAGRRAGSRAVGRQRNAAGGPLFH